MKTIRWQIQLTEPPSILHYCKKCRQQNTFFSSGLFRINAQRKALDIWLIYHCVQCDTTWNFTIASRIPPHRFPKEQLEQFHNNDPALAMQYACNTAKLQKSGAVSKPVSYKILGECPTKQEPFTLQLHSEYPVPIRVAAVLRQQLGLSHRTLELLEQNGQITSTNGTPLKQLRLVSETVLLLFPPFPWLPDPKDAPN